VGSARRAIVAEVEGHRFVAPDNGLLTIVLESNPGSKVREITSPQYFHQPVSITFHGRDIFAPVAAHLAKGLAPSRLGKPVSDAILGDFTKPTQLADRRWSGVVLKIDRFGNVVTNLDWASFQGIAHSPFKLKAGRGAVTRCYPTYAAAPSGQLFAIQGSSGYVEVSSNQANAAAALGVRPGAVVELTLQTPVGRTSTRFARVRLHAQTEVG
jgi:hypothetical protein